MHSGPAVGGVVGSKIPHFSIFGETVEVASQMEAMGQPMKIQMTQTTANILESNGGFNVEPRGQIEIPKVTLVHFSELFKLRLSAKLLLLPDWRIFNFLVNWEAGERHN